MAATCLVVVGELPASRDVVLAVDDDVLVPFHGDDFGVAVWVTAVVDETSKATLRQQQSCR